MAPDSLAPDWNPGGQFSAEYQLNTPQVDLFGIENTNRDLYVGPGSDGRFAANDQSAFGANTERFNISLANVPGGAAGSQVLAAPLSYSDTIASAAQQRDTTMAYTWFLRGIATLPGGIPLYEDGILVGGIGVFFPGTTGFATAENSNLSAGYNPSLPDLSMEAEYIALAAAGGSKQAGFPVGTINGVPALTGFDLPSPKIQLAGITLDTVGPGGAQGPQTLINYVKKNFSLNTGNPKSGTNEKVDFAGDTLLNGKSAPSGWLVTPHASGGMTAAQVQQIIVQGINTANQTRSQLRPLGSTTQMVFAVSDSAGDILGLYRMPKLRLIFSIDVAVSKARDVAYYDDATQLKPIDQLPGIPSGTAFTADAFRISCIPSFSRTALTRSPARPWSILNDPGTNSKNGLSTGVMEPISAFTSVFGYDAFHPNTTFHKAGANTSGVVFFPGSSAIYVKGKIVGGFGVSGDGVDEDDVVTHGGIAGFDPDASLMADQFLFHGVRLPYQNFDRNPNG